jgi:hypothetical protein
VTKWVRLEVLVEVVVNGGPGSGVSGPITCEFLRLRVGDEPSTPLPFGKPAPRRLVRDLAQAAADKLEAERLAVKG